LHASLASHAEGFRRRGLDWVSGAKETGRFRRRNTKRSAS